MEIPTNTKILKIKTLQKAKKDNIENKLKQHSISILESPQTLGTMETPPEIEVTAVAAPAPVVVVVASVKPPLTLTKTTQPNFILRSTPREIVDRRKIAWLLKSGKVSDTPYNFENMKNKTQAKILKFLKITSPHNHLTLYYRKIKNGCVEVEYKREGKKNWGRAYPLGMLSLSALPRDVRNLISKEIYSDFDLRSAHASIFMNICSKNGIKCPTITRWVTKKAEVSKIFYDAFKLDPKVKRSEKIVKDLINSTLYGGGERNTMRWYKDWDLKGNLPKFWFELSAELKEINKELIKNNEVLKEFARSTKKSGCDGKDAGWELTFLAYYAQEHEFRLVGAILERLAKETTVLKSSDYDTYEYEYDGFKVLTKNITRSYETAGKFIETLNKWSKELGYDVKWEEKEMDTTLNWEGLTADFVEFDEKEVKSEIATLMKKMKDPMGIKTDAGMARFINRVASVGENIFRDGEWKCWEEDNNCWKSHSAKEHPRKLAKLITETIPMEILDEVAKIKEKIGDEILTEELSMDYESVCTITDKFVEHIQDTFTRNKIFGACETEMNRDVEFDLNGDLIGFTNGVFDIKEFKFRPYNIDDYVSMNTGWEFNEHDWLIYNKACEECVPLDETSDIAIKIKEVEEVFAGIMPNPAIRTLLKMIYASSLRGQCLEKFIIFNGAGRNGKGLLNEFWACCIGEYAYNEMPYEVYTDPINSTNGNPALAKISKKRWVRSLEPKKSKKLCNAAIKSLTGGEGIQARKLYSNDTKIYNHGTYGVECNDRLGLQEDPQPNGAESERFIDILYPNRFTELEEEVNHKEGIYRGNPLLKTDMWKHPHRSAMMCIILRHLKMLMENDFRMGDFIPMEVRKRTEAYLSSNIQIHKVVSQLCDKVDIVANAKPEDIPFVEVTELIKDIHNDIDDRRELAKDCWKKSAMKEFFETSALYKKNYMKDHYYTDFAKGKQHKRCVLLWYKYKPTEEEEIAAEEAAAAAALPAAVQSK